MCGRGFKEFDDLIPLCHCFGYDSYANQLFIRSVNETWDIAHNKGRSMRDAAYALAMHRLGDGIEAHGTQKYFNQ